jgi:hypothetical protein
MHLHARRVWDARLGNRSTLELIVLERGVDVCHHAVLEEAPTLLDAHLLVHHLRRGGWSCLWCVVRVRRHMARCVMRDA